MRNNINIFETFDYSSDNQFDMSLKNKKVVGLMKDECNGKIITELVGLRSKMCSLRINGKDYIKKAKRVKMPVVRKTIEFDDYIACFTMTWLKIALNTCFGHIFIKSERSSKRNLLWVLLMIKDICYPTARTLCPMDIIE